MKVSLRVLSALNEKSAPDAADVATLRAYVGERSSESLDELACEVIQLALQRRARVRHAVRGG